MTVSPLLLVLAVGALTAPDCATSQELRGDEVRSVRFEGNATFPPDSLARAIVTKETDCRSAVLTPFCWLGMGFALRRSPLREREIPLDQARLMIWYQRRGFLDVQVDTPVIARRQGQADVRFRVREGSPVIAASIAFEGVDDFVESGLLDDLPLREGDRLSTLTRDATREVIIDRLRDRGYAHADVFFRALRPAEDPNRAEITFEVDPGPLTTYGSIDIQGIEELSPGTIRRTLQFSPGEVYRDSEIEAARGRLFGLDIVRSARVEPDLSVYPDSVVPVAVFVQEGDAYRVRAGGGLSTAECFSAEARWTSRNFLGGGRLLQVRGRLGNILAPQLGDQLCNDAGSGDFADLTWVSAVDLQQPWILSTDNFLTISVFAERQTLPDIFIRTAVGFQAALTRTLDPRTTLTLSYRPELSELVADDVLYCTGFLVCTPEDLDLLQGRNWLAPVGLSFLRDRSDDLLNPRSGFRVGVELEHAANWTGSNFRYDRAVLEATAYQPLGGPLVAATRLRAGWVGEGAFDALSQRDVAIVHPQRRFFAGGANSVRGFAQSRLGPRVLVVQRVEDLLRPTATGGAGCTPESIMDQSCDAGVGRDDDSVAGDSIRFAELPTGGTRVLEANVEVRFPIASWLEGVAFTDLGQAWGTGETIATADIQVTPGFGVRFPSPVGPIRVDLAYRPRGAQELSVITSQVAAYDPAVHEPEDQLVVNGMSIPYVRESTSAVLIPTVRFLEGASRFQLHVSIGQAF